MELEESARQLPGDLRDIVDKLEVRLEKAELKIKEHAFPPHVPGSLPGKCLDAIVGQHERVQQRGNFN